MQIVVTRVDAHRYSTLVERDSVRLRVPGYGFMRALPHDLAHWVVEGSLRLRRGFWGSVADGAEFAGMQRIEGRRKPHATQSKGDGQRECRLPQRSRAVSRVL